MNMDGSISIVVAGDLDKKTITAELVLESAKKMLKFSDRESQVMRSYKISYNHNRKDSRTELGKTDEAPYYEVFNKKKRRR